jgi:predicted ATPase/class 3 adenylate cyclase
VNELPSGTVTFLFTDIEGSTALWERDRAAMEEALEVHLELLRIAIEAHGGVLFKIVGDATQSAFPSAPGAVMSAVEAQRTLLAHSWSAGLGQLRVRMALHVGAAIPRNGDYLAAPLNRLARLLAAGHGTQIVLTQVVKGLVTGFLPSDVSLHPLGTHRLRDLHEPEEVYEVIAPGLPGQFPPLASLSRHPNNLPTPPTTLIGRAEEIAAIMTLLTHGTRLVTLTGSGGSGKTRLALEIGAEALDRYPDGVFFVDLSALTDPTLVVPTIASALKVREVTGQSLRETLAGFFASKQLLLLLDNCEQVLAAAADIAALLAATTTLGIVATSREPLHVRGEREFHVPPLSVPAADRLPPLAELAEVPAVALFVERATATDPAFVLGADNVAAIVEIARRLDGLPLAIELAAARIRALSPTALLTRLERRLPLLTGGGRDLPTRQRTMRDTIAWSYDLLTSQEQALFRHLAVFAGGFTLDAAEAVTTPDGTLSVIDGMVALVEQSLLRKTAGPGDEPRYQMLETLREYGLERLHTGGEEDAARERHAMYFLRLADSRELASRFLQDPVSLTPFAADRDNLRLALAWFDARGEIEALLRLSMVLFNLNFAPGHYREAMYWLARVRERSSAIMSADRVHVLTAEAAMAVYQDELSLASQLDAEALALARVLRDPLLIGQVLAIEGWVLYRRGDYSGAEAALEESYRHLHDLVGREPSAIPLAGIALLVRGDTALVQQQFNRAVQPYQEASKLFRSIGDDWRLSDVQAGLGGVSYCLGNIADAAALYAENLTRAYSGGYTVIVASSLLGLAVVAAELGQPEAGARLLGAAEGIAASVASPIFPRDQPVRDRGLDVLMTALGPERFSAAREAGRALALEAATAEGQAVAVAFMPSPENRLTASEQRTGLDLPPR